MRYPMNQPETFELILTVKEEYKENLCDILHALGEDSFVEGAIDCDIPLDYSHQNPHLYEEFAQNTPITIYSEDPNYLNTLLLQIKEHISFPLEEKLQPIPNQNWRESWKESFKPVFIDDTFVILPPWEPLENYASIPYPIIIDPGMAFGTGQHESTRLCLQLLLQEPQQDSILDIGCGSGILSIAAALRGSSHVIGCDIDEDSVRISQENAKINGVEKIHYTSTLVHEIEGSFDIIFANIQAGPLKQILPGVFPKLKKGGCFILSGLLKEEEEDFKAWLLSQNRKVETTLYQKDWMGLLVR